jgi:P27 family predicted phage terminase small subunit
MRRGRPPKPTHLKLLEGNPGRRPINAQEPKPPAAEKLTPPIKLADDAKKFWRYFAPKLKEARILSEIDLHSLAAAAEWWGIYRRAMNAIRDGSLTQSSAANGTTVAAEFTVAQAAFKSCSNVMASFGLSPADRTRIKGLEAPKKNRLEEFFGRKGKRA